MGGPPLGGGVKADGLGKRGESPQVLGAGVDPLYIWMPAGVIHDAHGRPGWEHTHHYGGAFFKAPPCRRVLRPPPPNLGCSAAGVKVDPAAKGLSYPTAYSPPRSKRRRRAVGNDGDRTGTNPTSTARQRANR